LLSLVLIVVLVLSLAVGYSLRNDTQVLQLLEKVQLYILAYTKHGSSKAASAFQKTQENYGAEVDELAVKYGLPANYLKALIVLECSGLKPVKPRFEKHIFNKLKRVRDNEQYFFESITHEQLQDASDAALENLSRSWGPFQLMGYKCLQLGAKVNDIRGDEAIEWGMQWIKMEYGHLLKRKKYRDALHYHNTGRLFPEDSIPLTHDPEYINRGLEYMEHFR